MSADVIRQVQEALEPAWQALIEQQYVIAAQQVVFAFFLLVTVIFTMRAGAYSRIRWESISEKGGAYESDGWAIATVAAWCVSFLLLAVAIGLMLDGFGHLVNPAGNAVQGIIAGLKP